jgi:hypothetical protein
MKITKFITASLLATLALAACHNDDMPGGNTLPEGAVHITAGIEGVQTRAPQLDANGAGTFEATDEWGMYTFTGDATSPAYSNENIAYQADNSNPLYWEDLSETQAVTFSAHYPYITADITNPAAYLYMPQAYNNTDDLLHATTTASKGGTVALTFKHLMHRLVVHLTAGDGMTGTDLSSAQINSVAKDGYTPTMFARVEVNLLTGAVNYDRVDGGVIFSNGGGANADWKVAPQDLTVGAEWLRITVGEDVWYYHVPATLNSSDTQHPTRLESGKRLTLNLTLKKSPDTGNTEVELTSGTISGWDTQPPITDEVVIGGITTYDALIAAVAAATGTEDAPARITLTADITLPWVDGAEGVDASVIVSDGKYIEIDGGGHSLFPHKYGNAFWIRGGASLKLSNITIDGQDADRDTPVITMFGTATCKLTLGKDFKLTRAKMRTSTYSEYAPYGIDGAQGTLVIEDGAEISGCGNGVAIRVNSNCSLRLKGGKVSGNSGYSIRLMSGIRPVDARIENTLPANALFENIFLDSYSDEGDVRAGFETVFTAAPGCTLTADDFAKFTLKEVDMITDAFELYLDANAIKLRKKN